MRTSTLKFVPAVWLVLLALAGCATETPVLDSHFGEAVNAAKAKQTVNPDASQDTNPVAGVDGQAANAAMDRYHKSFEKPPVTPNVFNIGVGSSGSSGGSGGGSSAVK